MNFARLFHVLRLLSLAGPGGCADVREFVYNSVNGAAHANCTRRAPADYDTCESNVNRASYRDYERERARLQTNQTKD